MKFTTKQQYTDFQQVWSNAVNSSQAKSYLVPFRSRILASSNIHDIIDQLSFIRYPGWITGSHVIIYNILRDKPLDHGFSDYKNSTKILHNIYYNQGFIDSLRLLINYKELAKKYIEIRMGKSNENVYQIRFILTNVDKFLKPFGDYFTAKQLSELELPKIGDISKPITYEDKKAIRAKMLENSK